MSMCQVTERSNGLLRWHATVSVAKISSLVSTSSTDSPRTYIVACTSNYCEKESKCSVVVCTFKKLGNTFWTNHSCYGLRDHDMYLYR